MRFLILVISFISCSISAQVNLDSLWGVWTDESKADTSRLKALGELTWDGYLFSQPDSAFYFAQKLYDFAEQKKQKEYQALALNIQGSSFYLRSDYEKAIDYYSESLEIREAIGDKYGVAALLNNIGVIYYNQGDYKRAIEYYNRNYEIQLQIGDKRTIGESLNNIAILYQEQGDYAKAIEMHTRSLKVREEIEDMQGIATSLNNIGVLYQEQEVYDKARDFHEKSMKIKEEIEDKVGLSASLNNLGIISRKQGSYTEALEYFNRSLKMREELGEQKGVAETLNNIGQLYEKKREEKKAQNFYKKALEIQQNIKDQQGIASSLVYLANNYHQAGEADKAEKYSSEAIAIAQEIGAVTIVRDAAITLWELYKDKGNYKASLEMYELYIETRDSIDSEENQKEIIRQEYKYQYEKQAAADSIKTAEEAKVKDAQLAAEKAENKQHKLEAKQQEQQKYFLFGGLGLALLFGGFVFNRYRVTNKQKGIIEKQKKQVDAAYDELEEKNTEILDSINYAKRIQSAILPPNKVVKEYLQESFILYKPKDIVAGDFYWLEHTNNKVLFAAADCTGHGVPGAMVSVVCNNGLNRSVREHGLSDPGKILDKTREIVISEFEKSEEEVKDGMDIALCSLEGTTLKYAGAHNPLWIIRKDSTEVEEIKADKQPIGKYDELTPYTTHTIELNEGDSFYIFSDGYADQFGGDKGKKFKAANFKKLLQSIQSESMELQKELIDEAFENWKGELEQLDDVCVIGVRV